MQFDNNWRGAFSLLTNEKTTNTRYSALHLKQKKQTFLLISLKAAIDLAAFLVI